MRHNNIFHKSIVPAILFALTACVMQPEFLQGGFLSGTQILFKPGRGEDGDYPSVLRGQAA